MEPYKYCDWHRVREQGIIFLSVLQKELEAIMKLVSAIFETKKKQRKIFTQCVGGSFTTSHGTLQMLKIWVGSEKDWGRSWEKTRSVGSGKLRATDCWITVIRKIICLYMLVLPFGSSAGNWCWRQLETEFCTLLTGSMQPLLSYTLDQFAPLALGAEISDLPCS